MVATLAGSGPTPLLVSLCPMKVTDGDLKWSFFAESCRSCSAHFSKSCTKFRLWLMSVSSVVLLHPYREISLAMLITLRRPSKNSCWRCWYFSETSNVALATVWPWNVVIREDFSSSTVVWDTSDTSTMMKTLAQGCQGQGKVRGNLWYCQSQQKVR